MNAITVAYKDEDVVKDGGFSVVANVEDASFTTFIDHADAPHSTVQWYMELDVLFMMYYGMFNDIKTAMHRELDTITTDPVLYLRRMDDTALLVKGLWASMHHEELSTNYLLMFQSAVISSIDNVRVTWGIIKDNSSIPFIRYPTYSMKVDLIEAGVKMDTKEFIDRWASVAYALDRMITVGVSRCLPIHFIERVTVASRNQCKECVRLRQKCEKRCLVTIVEEYITKLGYDIYDMFRGVLVMK